MTQPLPVYIRFSSPFEHVNPFELRCVVALVYPLGGDQTIMAMGPAALMRLAQCNHCLLEVVKLRMQIDAGEIELSQEWILSGKQTKKKE